MMLIHVAPVEKIRPHVFLGPGLKAEEPWVSYTLSLIFLICVLNFHIQNLFLEANVMNFIIQIYFQSDIHLGQDHISTKVSFMLS